MGVIVFNGISSEDYNIVVEHPPEYETPEKDYEIVHVPGRNGDIVLDKGSYKNTVRKYQVAFGVGRETYTSMANILSEWLHSASGYARLEDSYEPEYFRMALYEEASTIGNLMGLAGRATITFNCKPQRFLVDGEKTTVFTSSGRLINPTGFKALPKITVRGSESGTLTVGDRTVSISSISSFVVIDSELQDAYKDSANMNQAVTLSNGFPILNAGETSISFTGGITSVEVIPRWWTL